MYIMVEEGLFIVKVMFVSQGFLVYLVFYGWEVEWINIVDQ